ncbi:MAG: DUF1295 domain-containing protein [Erysipelotrichaceae bacterium]|nr:DUF1295 domain-containing protein [Erysipelotrichaceae bacterium]
MIFPKEIWIIVIVSLLLCSMGFKRFVWFMSVGYGVSAAGIGLTLLIMSLIKGNVSLVYLLMCITFIVYGVRLGGFLFIRELKNEKYRAKAAEAGSEVNVPIFVSIIMWIYCGFFYVFQSSGPVYRLLNNLNNETSLFLIIGTVISIMGVSIEALADKQKSDAKKINSDMPAMDGLYKLCRCPNYFGEMMFWTGAFISGIGAYQGAQWIIAIIGYAEIMIIMISGGKRVETRHIKHYGDKPEYNKWANTTPLLFPFIPMYHMTSPEKIAKEEAAKKEKAAKKKNAQ